ncbi:MULTISPECIES: YncE family protein [Streptomyces]|uniref:YncE family protein n=1 Tax=Streptomyces ramulosus TaxID=47762 RepID=A0ABW1FG96_9ACTN
MRRAAPALLAAALLLAGCATQGVEDAAPKAGNSAPAPAGRTPHGTLLVADFGADTVSFVDPRRGAFDAVRVGTAPYGLAVGDDGRAWVATAEGVAVVDTETRKKITRIPYRTKGIGAPVHGEYRGGGMGIALAPDGRHAYVGVNRPGTTGTVEVIDTRTLKATGAAEAGRRPFDVDVAPDGRAVYATGHDSFDVTVVTPGSLRTRRIEVAPYDTEGGLGSWLKPHYAAVRPSDGRLLLPFEGEKLVVLDPVTGRSRIEKTTARTHQHGVTITPDGTLFAVGTGAVEQGRGPSLTVRAPGGRERVIGLDGPHENVAVAPDGRTAYVTGGFTRDGYWNGISVVDVASGTVHRLAAGQRPLGVAVL